MFFSFFFFILLGSIILYWWTFAVIRTTRNGAECLIMRSHFTLPIYIDLTATCLYAMTGALLEIRQAL